MDIGTALAAPLVLKLTNDVSFTGEKECKKITVLKWNLNMNQLSAEAVYAFRELRVKTVALSHNL